MAVWREEEPHCAARTCSADMRVRGGVSEGVAAGVVEHDASPGGAWRAVIEGVGGMSATLLEPPPVVPPVSAVTAAAAARTVACSTSFTGGRPRPARVKGFQHRVSAVLRQGEAGGTTQP